MDISDRTSRSLVTAGLLIGLGLAGWFPPTAARAAIDTPVPVAQTPEKCCCGTGDGRCCGMGCCMTRQAPDREHVPGPNPREMRDGRNQLPALATVIPAESSQLGRRSFRSPDDRILRWLAESSLQARHVRIDA